MKENLKKQKEEEKKKIGEGMARWRVPDPHLPTQKHVW